MPTIAQKIAGFKAAGRYDEAREFVYKKTGVYLEDMHPDNDWGMVKAAAKATDIVKPATDITSNMTAGMDAPSYYLKKMGEFGEAMSPTESKPTESKPKERPGARFYKPGVMRTEFPEIRDPLEGVTDIGGRAVVGAAKGAVDTSIAYAGKMLPALAILSGQAPSSVMMDPTLAPLSGETPGQKYMREVVEPALQKSVPDRAWDEAADLSKSTVMLARGLLGGGTKQERQDMGMALGEGVTSGLAGSVEALATHPSKVIPSQPVATGIAVLGPAARGIGAGLRAGALARKSGRLAKGLHVAGDLLDPQPATRRVDLKESTSFDASPAQIAEYQKYKDMEFSGMLPEGMADKWLGSLKQDFTARRAREATQASPASKVGYGMRRAAAGALLGPEIFGGGGTGMAIAGGLAAGAPPLTMMAARKILSPNQRNRVRQAVVDPGSMVDPQSEAVVQSTTREPLQQGLGIHDMGVEASARASTAKASMRRTNDPLKVFRDTLVVTPESSNFQAPPRTVGHRMALDEGRMREGAAISGGKFGQKELDAAARATSGPDQAPYRTAKQYIKERDAAKKRLADNEAAAKKVLKLREKDPGAFDYENSRLAAAAAKDEYLRERGKLDLDILEQEARMSQNPALMEEFYAVKEEYQSLLDASRRARKELEAQTQEFRQSVTALAELEGAQTGRVFDSADPAGRALAQEGVRALQESERSLSSLLENRRQAWAPYEDARKRAAEAFGRIEAKAQELFDLRRDSDAANAALGKRKEVLASLPEDEARAMSSGIRTARSVIADETATAGLAERAVNKARQLRDRLRNSDNENAGKVLEQVVEGDRAGKAAIAAEKSLAGYPETERAARLASGQLELVGKLLDPRKPDGTPLKKKYGLFLESEGVASLVDAAAALVRTAAPDSPLGSAEYVGQVIASVWHKKALVGAFSPRLRGYISKAMTAQLVDGVGYETIRTILKNNGIENADRMSNLRLRQNMNSILEQKIVEKSSEAIVGGHPTEFRLRVVNKDGREVTLDSGDLAAKFLNDPNRPMSDRRAAAQQAVSGVFDVIRTHFVKDKTNTSVAQEAIRTMNPDRSAVDSVTNGWTAASAATNSGTVSPNVLMFNPADFAAQLSDPKSLVHNARRWFADYDSTDQMIIDRVRKASDFFSQNFEEAGPAVRGAIHAGMKNLGGHGRSVPDGAPIYVRKGYNEAVGTHIEFTRAIQQANGMLNDFANYGRVAMLAGSTGTQVANMMSNVTAISLATGSNPYKVMLGISKEFYTLWAQVEKGTLAGAKGLKYRGIMKTGIADSSMLSERFGAMFGAHMDPKVFTDLMSGDVKGALNQARDFMEGGSSKGRVRALAEWGVNLRKEIYKQGDTGPKLYLTSKAYDDIHGALVKLEPMHEIEMPTGAGSYIKVRRTGFHEYEINGKRAMLDSQDMADAIAKSAKLFASNILFDFNDLPGWVKKLASKGGAYTYFNPFLSWAWKASELPGKPGLVGHMLGYDPTWGLKTNSPSLMRDRSKKFAKLAIKRKVQSEAFRQLGQVYDSAGMGEIVGWDGSSDALILNPYSEKLEVYDSMDMSSMMPTVKADVALRLLHSGGGAAVGMIMNRSPQDYADMLRSDDPAKKAVGRLYVLHTSRDLSQMKNLAEYFNVTGGLFQNVMTYLQEEKRGVAAAQLMLRLVAGGDAQGLINAGLEANDPATDMTNRRFLKGARPSRKEDFAGWWLYSMFRLGFRENDLRGDVDRWVKNREKAIDEHYIRPLKKRDKLIIAELRQTRPGTPEHNAVKAKLSKHRANMVATKRAFKDVTREFRLNALKAKKTWRDKVRKNKERRLKSGRKPRIDAAVESASGAAGRRDEPGLAQQAAMEALSTQTR